MGNTCCSDSKSHQEIPNTTLRCDPSSEWATAVHEGNFEEIKAIYADNPKFLNVRINTNGDTAMHIACRRKEMPLVEFLLKHDADVNIPSLKTGNTALHEAALRENVYMVTMLIHHGSDPKALNKMGKSPKSLATKREIKAMFKSRNIERIRNQRSLRQLLETPTSPFDHNDILRRQHSDSFGSDTMFSSSLPSGAEFSFNESFIGRIEDIHPGYTAFIMHLFSNYEQ